MDTDVHELAGAYALDALPDEERRFFERHLVGCAACGEEVAGFQDAVAALGSAGADSPPAGLRERVLAEVAVTEQEQPAGGARAAGARPGGTAAAQAPSDLRHARLRTLVPAVAAGVVLLAGLTAIGIDAWGPGTSPAEEQLAQVTDAPDARTVDLEAPPGATARFAWSVERAAGVLVTEGLASAPDGHAYALWLIDDTAPALAGLFHPDEDGDVTHEVTDGIEGTVTVAVTVEPADTTGEGPTTEPLIVGNL